MYNKSLCISIIGTLRTDHLGAFLLVFIFRTHVEYFFIFFNQKHTKLTSIGTDSMTENTYHTLNVL